MIFDSSDVFLCFEDDDLTDDDFSLTEQNDEEIERYADEEK